MLTTDQIPQALTDAFNAAGIDTPEKITAFVQIAAKQVKLNTLNFQIQQLGQARSDAIAANQVQVEAVQATIKQTQTDLLGLIAAQA